MTTLTTLLSNVATALSDANKVTFKDPVLTVMVNEGVQELSRIAPRQFTEDITLVAGQTSYEILSGDVTDGARPAVKVTRAELWTTDATPAFSRLLVPGRMQGVDDTSQAGWRVWAGAIELPYNLITNLNVDNYVLRIWGWAPFTELTSGSDITDLTTELEYILLDYCRVAALRRLSQDRSLYQQWQQASNAADVSPGQLLGMLSSAESRWMQRKHELTVLHGGF